MIFDRGNEGHVRLMRLFINWGEKYLGISGSRVRIEFSRDKLDTTASYGGGFIRVYGKDRAVVDIMRSIGHEMVHMRQDMDGLLYDGAGDTGSVIENEANAIAGIMIRKFGSEYKEIYE